MTEQATQYRIMRNKKEEKYWVQVREKEIRTNYITIGTWKPCWFFGLWQVRDGSERIEDPQVYFSYYKLGRYAVNDKKGRLSVGSTEHWSFEVEQFNTIEDAQAAIDEQLAYDQIDNTYEGDWQP